MMDTPKFEKRNHHYIPQFWLRAFRGASGHLYYKSESIIKVISPRRIMASDWLYTDFDEKWQPSDVIEDALSKVEGKHSSLFNRLQTPSYIPTQDDRDELCRLLGLQACRHPDVLNRNTRLQREFASFLASAHTFTKENFISHSIKNYGLDEIISEEYYIILTSRSKEQLSEELSYLLNLSPQSPELPQNEALLAYEPISNAIKTMELILLDTISPNLFILGDTPLPQSDLINGFSVPLSKSLAVIALPSSTEQTSLPRRLATQTEVNDINHTQLSNCLNIVIGPSVEILKKLTL